MTSLPKVAGLAEIAEMARVEPGVIPTWRARYPDFPEPEQTLKMGPVYLESKVRKFLDAHPNLGGPPVRYSEATRTAIRAAIGAGETNVSALARQFKCSRGTIYNIASDLLFTDTQPKGHETHD